MAKTVAFNFDDQHWAMIVEAICTRRGYQSQIPNPEKPEETIPNPQSKEAFTMEAALDYWQGEFEAWYVTTGMQQLDHNKRMEAAAISKNMDERTEKLINDEEVK